MFEQRQVPDLKNVPQITGVGRGPRVPVCPSFRSRRAPANSTSASPPSVSVLHGTSGGGVNSVTATIWTFNGTSSDTASSIVDSRRLVVCHRSSRSTRSHDEVRSGQAPPSARRASILPQTSAMVVVSSVDRVAASRFAVPMWVNRERILPDSAFRRVGHSQVKVTRRCGHRPDGA